MITADITIDVKADTVAEADAAKAKLEAAGLKIIQILDPRTFKAVIRQTLSKEEV